MKKIYKLDSCECIEIDGMIAFRISKIIKDDKIFYKFMTDENSNKLYFMEEIIPNKEYEEVIDEELINWLIDNYCEELR